MQNENNLVRGISRLDLTAIVINTIIGAGIFGLPSQVTTLIGGYSLAAFAICALIIALIVLCFAEVGSRFDATGGSYLYAHEAFGSVVGFEVGWLYWIVRVTTGAANTNLLVDYIGFFYPAATEPVPRSLIIAAVILLLTTVNFIGVKQSAWLTNFFTVGKLLPLVLFVAVGLFFVQPANIVFSPVPDNQAFTNAILILIYAFVGFEVAAIPSGEVRDPQRSLPFALLTALGIIVVLYILIQIVCLGTLPGLADSKRPLADAANQFMGSLGATVIAVGAVISIFGNLNSGLLTASRLPFAMAERRELPRVLAKTHKRFKTPFVSLLFTSLVIFIFTLQTSFIAALTISTITRLLVYATTCAALPVFRTRKDAPEAKFNAPLGIICAVLSLGLIGFLLFNVRFIEFRNVAIIAALGLVIYFAYRFVGKKRA
jgi:basic amino acid/polyamine antiporter, APA family